MTQSHRGWNLLGKNIVQIIFFSGALSCPNSFRPLDFLRRLYIAIRHAQVVTGDQLNYGSKSRVDLYQK